NPAAEDTNSGHKQTLKQRKILILDDNATNRTILKAQMLKWRFEPTITSYATEALEVLAQGGDFDLVITDMHMPEMDGLEFSKIVKQRYRHLPILLLSSVGDDNHLN